MAENKKSFILYADLIHTVRKMSRQKAGELFMIILAYVNDEKPEVKDKIVDLVFEPIKHQLKRDLEKWDEFKRKQAVNGKLGGRPKLGNQRVKNPKNPSLFKKTQKSLNVTVNDTVTVNDIKEINKENAEVKLWTQEKNQFINSYQWKENFCREKKIEMSDLEESMIAFIANLELKEEFKDLKELKRHFVNSYNLNLKTSKNGTHGKNNAGGDKLGTSAARTAALKKWPY